MDQDRRKTMTRDDIRSWALAHGFTAETDNLLTAPYRKAMVSLALLPTAVRVVIALDDAEMVIGTFRYGNPSIRINEYDVLEGIGLSGSFRRFIGADGPQPVWMSDDYFAAAYGRERETALPMP